MGVYTLTETGPDGYTSSGFTVTGGGTLAGIGDVTYKKTIYFGAFGVQYKFM